LCSFTGKNTSKWEPGEDQGVLEAGEYLLEQRQSTTASSLHGTRMRGGVLPKQPCCPASPIPWGGVGAAHLGYMAAQPPYPMQLYCGTNDKETIKK